MNLKFWFEPVNLPVAPNAPVNNWGSCSACQLPRIVVRDRVRTLDYPWQAVACPSVAAVAVLASRRNPG